MPEERTSPYYTAEQAAGIIGVSRDTIYDWCENGTLAGARRFGKTWRIPRTSVDPHPSHPTEEEEKKSS